MHVLRNSSRLSSVGEETVVAGKKKKKELLRERCKYDIQATFGLSHLVGDLSS